MKNYDVSPKVIGQCVRMLLEQRARKVTAYLSPTLTVKASRRLFGKRIDNRSTRADIILTIGAPNYEERKFIALCKKAGEPFPVKKLQIKHLAAQ
jgi:hypothetical protein